LPTYQFHAHRAKHGDARIALCQQSAKHAALACMEPFGTTDFREDLKKLKVPTLVIHAMPTRLCLAKVRASAPTAPCVTGNW
jgi:pimeloyl-ACP methyl ester carboxylesterase